jgi:hypothetical protein
MIFKITEVFLAHISWISWILGLLWLGFKTGIGFVSYLFEISSKLGENKLDVIEWKLKLLLNKTSKYKQN